MPLAPQPPRGKAIPIDPNPNLPPRLHRKIVRLERQTRFYSERMLEDFDDGQRSAVFAAFRERLLELASEFEAALDWENGPDISEPRRRLRPQDSELDDQEAIE